MKALITILVSLCLATLAPICLSASRQSQDRAKVARKLDEYRYGVGRGRVGSDCDVDAHLDNFAYSIKAEPRSRGYMIFYRGRRKPPKYFAFEPEWQHGALMSEWEFEEGRVVLVDGGYREEAGMELWIAPEGAGPPRPTPAFRAKRRRKS